MAANNENRRDEGLQALGAKTKYRDDYAPEVLESFVNKHQGNDYWVRFNCPEFTSLCPITHCCFEVSSVSAVPTMCNALLLRLLSMMFA